MINYQIRIFRPYVYVTSLYNFTCAYQPDFIFFSYISLPKSPVYIVLKIFPTFLKKQVFIGKSQLKKKKKHRKYKVTA